MTSSPTIETRSNFLSAIENTLITVEMPKKKKCALFRELSTSTSPAAGKTKLSTAKKCCTSMCKHLITQIINKARVKIQMQVSGKSHKFAIYLRLLVFFLLLFVDAH